MASLSSCGRASLKSSLWTSNKSNTSPGRTWIIIKVPQRWTCEVDNSTHHGHHSSVVENVQAPSYESLQNRQESEPQTAAVIGEKLAPNLSDEILRISISKSKSLLN